VSWHVPRRKAYRLGKWLGDLNSVRKTPLSVRYSYLEILASGGEGVYYFVEQLTWCRPSLAHLLALSRLGRCRLRPQAIQGCECMPVALSPRARRLHASC